MIEFVDGLPEKGRPVPTRVPWGTDIAPELRQRPMAWALLEAEHAPDGTSGRMRRMRDNITYGRTRPWGPPGDYEATLWENPDGSVELYARYVGGGAL